MSEHCTLVGFAHFILVVTEYQGFRYKQIPKVISVMGVSNWLLIRTRSKITVYWHLGSYGLEELIMLCNEVR